MEAPPLDTASDTNEVTGCGPVPPASPCNTMRCTAAGWIEWPQPANTPCVLPTGAGECDGGVVVQGQLEPDEIGRCLPLPTDATRVLIPIQDSEMNGRLLVGIQGKVNALLDETQIMISHTSGPSVSVPSTSPECTLDEDGFAACAESCSSTACKLACKRRWSTCVDVCSEATALSYIDWGPALGGYTCGPNTCPACDSPTLKPRPSEPLSIAPEQVKGFTCRLNRWLFEISSAQLAEVSTGGDAVTLSVLGRTGLPAVSCGFAGPDFFSGPVRLRISLGIGVADGRLTVEPRGELAGTFNPGSVFWGYMNLAIDFDRRIHAAFKTKVTEKLEEKRDFFQTAVERIITTYLSSGGYPAPRSYVSVQATAAGLLVTYLR